MYILSVTAVQIGAQVWQNPTRTITGGIQQCISSIGCTTVTIAALSSATLVPQANFDVFCNMMWWNQGTGTLGWLVTDNVSTTIETGWTVSHAMDWKLVFVSQYQSVGLNNHDSTLSSAMQYNGMGFIK